MADSRSSYLRRPAAVGEVRGARRDRATSFSWNEIARSLPGDDQRLTARRLKLGSQPADVHADVFRLRLVSGAPDLAQQVRTGQQSPPVDGEFAQPRELGRREAPPGAGKPYLLAHQVDRQAADGDPGRRGLGRGLGDGPGPAQRGTDPR